MEDQKIKILYVDDEKNNLISFKANFRKFYEIFTAESAEEGRLILNTEDIHVLITDQRMPKLTGVQFLESILKDFPFPTRIIMTGYTDLETVVEAINKGQIYRYIIKPFDLVELKTVIDTAYDAHVFRKNSEVALNKFRYLFENSNDAIFIMDPNGQFQELNHFGLNLFKVPRSDLRSVSLASLFYSSADYSAFYAMLIKNEAVIDYPVKLKNYKNNLIDCLISAAPIKEEQNLIGYQCMIRDITKQKEMENLVIRAIIETQENERIRFGKNLHDSIGQKLASIRLFLQKLEGDYNLKSDDILKKSYEVLDFSINELRNICFNIMPKTLEVLGLKGALNELKRQNDVPNMFEFSADLPEDLPKFNVHLEIAIFRIVQEFLSNSLTHGDANKVELEIKYKTKKIQIALRDNGQGFDLAVADMNNGMGLKNIKSRVQSYNGEITIISNVNRGTEILISIPIDSALLKKQKSLE